MDGGLNIQATGMSGAQEVSSAPCQALAQCVGHQLLLGPGRGSEPHLEISLCLLLQ